MKASLAGIALLFVSPAYAFENLIIDSTLQYPVGLTDTATSWSDAQMTAPPLVQGRNSWAVPGFAGAPNFPAVPNLSWTKPHRFTKSRRYTEFGSRTKSPRSTKSLS